MQGIIRNSLVSLAAGTVIALVGIAAQAAPPGEASASNIHGDGVHRDSASLDLTSALCQAGGGTEGFSMKAALVSMLGEDGADDEIAKLEHRYGTRPVQKWLKGSDWLMLEGLTQLRNTGTDLPEPSTELTGAKLAAALVDAGVAPGDTRFSTDYYYDHLFSHGIKKVMETEMSRKFSERYAKTVFTINDQAMYDVSQQIQTRSITLGQAALTVGVHTP